MTDAQHELLLELEQFGRINDAATSERPRRMLNIARDTGELLALLVRATKARRLLEIGTSNGYSTLWLALAASAGDGHVTTVESSAFKCSLAAENFARAGLADCIPQVHGDAGGLLENASAASFDFVFFDSDRAEYPGWWPQLRRLLRPGSLLVVDNATSHASELAPFIALVAADPEFTSCTVPVSNGEFMATRSER